MAGNIPETPTSPWRLRDMGVTMIGALSHGFTAYGMGIAVITGDYCAFTSFRYGAGSAPRLFSTRSLYQSMKFTTPNS